MKKLFINLQGVFVNVIFFKLEMFYESYKLNNTMRNRQIVFKSLFVSFT